MTYTKKKKKLTISIGDQLNRNLQLIASKFKVLGF